MSTKVLRPQNLLARDGPRRRQRSGHGGVTTVQKRNAVIGHVRLLRRGEALDSISPKIPKLSDLEITPEIYAGASSFYSSPSPRSVPVPTFFNKKEEEEPNSFEDGATMFLRRVLQLE